jgi:hypothetical protein
VSPQEYSLKSTLGRESLLKASPAYSLGARLAEPTGDKEESPGPNAYNVPSLIKAEGGTFSSTVASSPRFTMRPRGREVSREAGPSPVEYSPSFRHVRSSSPAFSFRPRTSAPLTGPSPDVGPNKYALAASQATALRPRTPAFSLGERTVTTDDINVRSRATMPAPGAYAVPSAIGVSPFWSNSGGASTMRARLNDPSRAQTPSPLEYSLPSTLARSMVSVWKSAPSTRLATRGPRLAPSLGSGAPSTVSPLSYDVPSAFSPRSDKVVYKSSGLGSTLGTRRFHGSLAAAATLVDSPSPDAYGVPSRAVVTHPQPRFSRSARLSSPARSSTPGPNSYDVDLSMVESSSPRFSMRARTASPLGRSSSPAPNAFNLQGFSLKRNSPKFSIKLRWKPERTNDTPGPGAYGTLHLPAFEKFLQRTASFKSPFPGALESVRRSMNSGGGGDTVA